MQRIELDDPIEKHVRKDFTPLQVGQNVGEALAQLRAKPQGGRIVYFYVTDDQGVLVGVVPSRLLLLSPLTTPLRELMITKVVTIPRTATVLDACELFILHKFLALPVVDEKRKLIGIVDIELYTDEIADLAQRTGYDDLFQLVGIRAQEARAGTLLNAFRRRFPWLLCNVAGGILAAFLTGAFQDVLDRRVVLALFVPVVLSLSESIGIQSVSLALQTLHGEHGLRAGLRALRRELMTGVLLGLGCGPLVAAVAWIWKGQLPVAATILVSIGLAMTFAALIGMGLPLVLHLIRRDPRVAAGPVALVLADLFTLFVYLGLATVLIR